MIFKEEPVLIRRFDDDFSPKHDKPPAVPETPQQNQKEPEEPERPHSEAVREMIRRHLI